MDPLSRVHGAWVELYSTLESCTGGTDLPSSNYDGLVDGQCYPYAGPHHRALRVNCSTNVLEEMADADNCNGTVSFTWTGAGEGDCLSNGVDATTRFSCASAAPMSQQYLRRQWFTDSACSDPVPPSTYSQTGLAQYLPDQAAFAQPGCNAEGKWFNFLRGGADGKAELIRIQYADGSSCSGDWINAARTPLVRCVPVIGGPFVVLTAPSGPSTPPASVPAAFAASWPPPNAAETKYCTDHMCTAPAAAVSLLATRLGRCSEGQRFTCRGDYLAALSFAEPACTGAILGAELTRTGAPTHSALPLGTVHGCSSPSGSGLTPTAGLPTLASLFYHEAKCTVQQ